MNDRPSLARADLETQVGWIHQLARSLVFDQSRVDDVVQESWLALRSAPPASARDPRAWTASVVRNVARKFARGERRRAQRERGASRPELQPDTRELEERAELHKRLVDAVLGLDEPYRSTLLARFFDGRPPRVIARERGVPVATVDSWLRRGLETLRSRLDAEFGDRTSWCLACLPLAQLAGGGAKAALPAKLIGAAVLLVALSSFGLWRLARPEVAGGGAAPLAELEASGPAPTQSAGVGISVPPAEPARRSEAAAHASAPGLLVREADGVSPAARTRVRFANLVTGERGEVRTDQSGLATLPAFGRYALVLDPEQGLGALATLELDARGATLTLPPCGALALEFVDAHGRPVEGVEAVLLDSGVGTDAQWRSGSRGYLQADLREAVESVLLGEGPVLREAPDAQRARVEERRWSALLARVAARSSASAGIASVWPAVELERTSRADGRVEWSALPPGGTYAIEVRSMHFPPRASVTTSDLNFGAADGRATLQQVGPFTIDAGRTTRQRIELATAGSLAGQLDTRGSVDPWSVELQLCTLVPESREVTGREVLAREHPDQQGRFVFGRVRPGQHTLRAQWSKGSDLWFVNVPVTIVEGMPLELGTIAPAEVAPLEVEAGFVDAAGTAIEPAGIYAPAAFHALAAVTLEATAASDPDWNFHVELEYGQRYRLLGIDLPRAGFTVDPLVTGEPPSVFLPQGWSRDESRRNIRVDLPAAGVQPLRICVQKLAQAQLQLVLPEGATEFPREIAGVALDEGGTDWRTEVGADGIATVRLRPGRYWLLVRRMPRAEAGVGLASDVRLALDEGSQTRVTLHAGCAIDGVVRLPFPKTVRFVAAWVERAAGGNGESSPWSAALDEQGRFHLACLPPQTELVLRAGFRAEHRELHVRTGAAGETLTVVIP